MDNDQLYMQRALELAALGLGQVSPNPMVGCVVIHNDKIIGEGWHQKHGEAHAEIMALDQITDRSILSECTLYVNLEPCSHHGKTPPCADRIIADQIKRVVICNEDTNPLVGGKGILKMKAANIQVDIGVQQDQGRLLNRRFFTYVENRRPYVILKWAETSDRFIARDNYESKWISGEYSRKLVHKWRSEEDSIMVGTNTANYDNPRLNVRQWPGKNPIRIVIDKSLRLSHQLNLFDGSQSTLCYNLIEKSQSTNLTFIKLSPVDFISNLLNDLFNRGIMSLIVEGGSQLLQNVIDAGLWDEARVFKSSKQFKKGINAPILNSEQIFDQVKSGEDQLITYRNQNIDVVK